MSFRTLTYWLGISSVGLLAGATVAIVAMADTSPGVQIATPQTDSVLTRLTPDDGPAAQSKTFDGFTVDFQRVDTEAVPELVTERAPGLVVYYRVSVEGSGAFAEMLGIPRIINPNGEFVLPSEYGLEGPGDAGFSSRFPGLPEGSSAAVFDESLVLPGAHIRFGPFFRSIDQPVTITATGEALGRGVSAEFGNERFTITALRDPDGTTTLELVNAEPVPSIVATHPTSRTSVVIDGKEVEQVHGSTNFAKTVGYDVNANRSTISIAQGIADTSVVTITSSSIGRVHRGAWDFAID